MKAKLYLVVTPDGAATNFLDPEKAQDMITDYVDTAMEDLSQAQKRLDTAKEVLQNWLRAKVVEQEVDFE
jgi:ABC-type transporter MlaC component